MTSATPCYWIVVGSPDNFAKTKELGFTIQGLKSRHRKRAERMKPGDKIVYYITGLKQFAGITGVTSEYFESHEIIWQSKDPKKAAEDYPHRVRIEPLIILPEGAYVDAEPLARQMAYATKWPPENWTLAFQGNLHEINAQDFALIESAIQQAADK
jgi:predicted RNA-binding protein